MLRDDAEALAAVEVDVLPLAVGVGLALGCETALVPSPLRLEEFRLTLSGIEITSGFFGGLA